MQSRVDYGFEQASKLAPLVRSAQPTVQSGAFDNRFGAWR
jgi:hypothetical protein